MIKAETLALCASDLTQRLNEWLDYLRHEKQVSKHTLRAYSADISHFMTFLHDHLGKEPGLNDLSEIGIRDFRAWMSKKTMDGPNKKGVGNASRARSLSGVKSLLTWLDRQGIMHNAAISTVRSPKLPHKLPRPLHENKAFEILDNANLLTLSLIHI